MSEGSLAYGRRSSLSVIIFNTKHKERRKLSHQILLKHSRDLTACAPEMRSMCPIYARLLSRWISANVHSMTMFSKLSTRNEFSLDATKLPPPPTKLPARRIRRNRQEMTARTGNSPTPITTRRRIRIRLEYQ